MKPDIELALSARAENIAIVRHALGGLGEVFGISEEKLSDIRLAVTEACSNVVMHAYHESGVDGSRPAAHPSTRKSSTRDIEAKVDVSGSPSNGAEGPLGWGMMEVSA